MLRQCRNISATAWCLHKTPSSSPTVSHSCGELLTTTKQPAGAPPEGRIVLQHTRARHSASSPHHMHSSHPPQVVGHQPVIVHAICNACIPWFIKCRAPQGGCKPSAQPQGWLTSPHTTCSGLHCRSISHRHFPQQLSHDSRVHCMRCKRCIPVLRVCSTAQ
jgi:hypothetical protein